MVQAKILLNTIDRVKDFSAKVEKFNFEVDLASGRYTVNAKSIMGIFSLDLSKPISLTAHIDDTVDEEVKARFTELVNKYRE